jgi:hypothetical protein
MANQATVNPTSEQQAFRTVGRIKTLRLVIAKRKKKGKDVASYEAELNRRLEEVNALKAALSEVY